METTMHDQPLGQEQLQGEEELNVREADQPTHTPIKDRSHTTAVMDTDKA